jgi:hypothetical protein
MKMRTLRGYVSRTYLKVALCYSQVLGEEDPE